MTDLLNKAETLDKYIELCNRSALNRESRKSLFYTPWHDQFEASWIRQEHEIPDTVQICIMNPSADGGMPHTRAGNLICIPAYFPRNQLEETIKHELVHLSQKKNPGIWIRRLVKEGWDPEPELPPEELIKRCRINPDTVQLRFVAWNGRYIPLPLFEREDAPKLRDIQVRWWDLEQEKLLLDAPKSYKEQYGEKYQSSLEHPFELWAYNR